MQKTNKSDVPGRSVENREARAKLARDYVENQKVLLQHKSQGGSECVQNGSLVFTVAADFKLYGADNLDRHFATAQYDPYVLYKQRLSSSVAHVAPRELPETA